MAKTDRIDILETEESYALLKKEQLESVDKIPDTVTEIKNNPIAKPLLEFNKQRKLLSQMLKQNLSYHRTALEEFNSLLQIDYNQSLDIVRVAQRLIELYQRMNITLNQAEEIAEKTLTEIYIIMNKEYTKKNA